VPAAHEREIAVEPKTWRYHAADNLADLVLANRATYRIYTQFIGYCEYSEVRSTVSRNQRGEIHMHQVATCT